MRDDWKAIPVSPAMYQVAKARGSKSFRAWLHKTGLQVLVGVEPIFADGVEGFHLSISLPDRYPTWDEQVMAIRDLLPGALEYASYVVPEQEHINEHEFCFHWWQSGRSNAERVYRARWV